MHGNESLMLIAEEIAPNSVDQSSGRYSYIEDRGWYLATQIRRDGSSSSIQAVHTRKWIAEDGSGRILRERSIVEGEPPVKSDDSFEPGKLFLQWTSAELSGSRAELGELVRERAGGTSAARLLRLISALYLEQPVPVKARANILRILADVPDLMSSSVTSDRGGRAGAAVCADSDYSGLPTRYTLGFDTHTGTLLWSEQMLTSSAGSLGVPIPFVTSYTLYLDSGRTDRMG